VFGKAWVYGLPAARLDFRCISSMLARVAFKWLVIQWAIEVLLCNAN